MSRNISLAVFMMMVLLIAPGCSIGGSNQANTTTNNTDQNQNTGDTTDTNSNQPVDELAGEDVYKMADQTAALEKAKELFNTANNLAKRWQSDAELLIVSTKYFSTLDDAGVVDKFIFSSDKNPDYYWSIDISREDTSKFTRTLIFRDDYIVKSDVLNIPTKYWKVTYAEALEKADMLGGYQFRKDYPSYQVSQLLSLAGGKNLAWYIVYSSPGAEAPYSIVIDAFSGEEIK